MKIQPAASRPGQSEAETIFGPVFAVFSDFFWDFFGSRFYLQFKLKCPLIGDERPGLFFSENRSPVEHAGARATAQDLAVQMSLTGGKYMIGIREVCGTRSYLTGLQFDIK